MCEALFCFTNIREGIWIMSHLKLKVGDSIIDSQKNFTVVDLQSLPVKYTCKCNR